MMDSVFAIFLAVMANRAKPMAEAKTAKEASIFDPSPGLKIISAPENPAITAIHLGQPTFSFRSDDDNAVTIIGAM